MRCVIIYQIKQNDSTSHLSIYVYEHLLRELNDEGNYLINLMRLCVKCFVSLKLECVVMLFFALAKNYLIYRADVQLLQFKVSLSSK